MGGNLFDILQKDVIILQILLHQGRHMRNKYYLTPLAPFVSQQLDTGIVDKFE